jgi:two-component system, chemotaxis family, protein-glutamate methylesterase/glutaminase
MSVRVVIVDDSPLVRGLLREALTEQPDLEVVGEAGDGLSALRLIKQARPDVVTMDVLMPIMGGPEAIRRVMQECPTPIVVFAAARADHNLAWQALESGAAEVFAKPTAGLDAVTVANLAAALRRAASARVASRRKPSEPAPGRSTGTTGTYSAVQPRVLSRGGTAAIGIVGSTGAPRVLQSILSALPANFPWPIAIVQHTLRGFTESLAKWLQGYTKLKVELGRHGTEMRRGLVVVAPDDAHLEIHAKGRIHLSNAPSVDGHRPSATVLLKSLASAYGMRAAGLVLTGMGRDGAEGAASIDAAKGLVIVEEPATAMLPSMPGEALARVPNATREETERLGRLLVELADK